MNAYKTIKVQIKREALFLQLSRPERNNSINGLMIREIMNVMGEYEYDPTVKIVVLEGNESNFCTGMDFNAIDEGGLNAVMGNSPDEYYEMLNHFSSCSKVIIAKVAGKVNAGGIGLIGASDIVIASEKATFGLSEALFGILPSCVMPFLIRRIGYQKALWLTLKTQPISALRAFQIGLVDELSDDLDNVLRKNLLRLTKLETGTVKELKNYMAKLWIIDTNTRKMAVAKTTELVSSEKVQNNIKNFIHKGIFPWSKQ